MAKTKTVTTAASRLRTSYDRELKPRLMQELSLDNPHQVPQLQKVVVSIGLGRAKEDKRIMEAAANTLMKITGQKPVSTLSRK